MVPSKSAITDASRLVALLYRADWTQLCLPAEFSGRAERPRLDRMKAGQQSRPRADEPDEESPRENWRLATEATEAPGDEGDEDEDDDERDHDERDYDDEPDYEEDLPPHWRDSLSRVLVAPGGRHRIEDSARDPDGGVVLVHDGQWLWRVGQDQAVRVPAMGLAAGLMGLLDPSWLIGSFDLELTGAAEAAGRPAYRVTATPRHVRTSARDDRYDRFDSTRATASGPRITSRTAPDLGRPRA